MKASKGRELTYAEQGIDRKVRLKSQLGIQAVLSREAQRYKSGQVVTLPFGKIFPISRASPYYYDLQIEGVGTKTLLAELSGKYDTIGVDGVAMAVNDILRSGADPLLVSDGIHIAKSDPKIVSSIISGVRAGAEAAGCILASGETGDVREILHNPISGEGSPFDLFVSCLGVVQYRQMIRGKISSGDRLIGLESSGIHSNGLSLARRVLLKKWGGAYESYDVPEGLDRPLIDELLEPTRIYAKAIKKLKDEDVEIKAAVHLTGDGLAKFWRLLYWQRSRSGLGLKMKLSRKPAIFGLIIDSAKKAGTPISIVEMFNTFNMGVGFAIVVSAKGSARTVDSLNNMCRAEDIGFVSNSGRISIESAFSRNPVFL